MFTNNQFYQLTKSWTFPTPTLFVITIALISVSSTLIVFNPFSVGNYPSSHVIKTQEYCGIDGTNHQVCVLKTIVRYDIIFCDFIKSLFLCTLLALIDVFVCTVGFNVEYCRSKIIIDTKHDESYLEFTLWRLIPLLLFWYCGVIDFSFCLVIPVSSYIAREYVFCLKRKRMDQFLKFVNQLVRQRANEAGGA